MELSIDFLEFRTWLLSTPMSLNANTPTLEMKKNEKSKMRNQREVFIVIDKITNILKHF